MKNRSIEYKILRLAELLSETKDVLTDVMNETGFYIPTEQRGILNALTFEGVGAGLEEAGKMAGVEVYTTPGQYTDEVYFEIDGVKVSGRVEKQLQHEIA